MTDGVVSQVTMVSPSAAIPDANVNTFAIVAVVSEIPPLAGGATINSFVIISVSREYTTPISYEPMSVGAFMQTMPYYIGQ